VAKGKFGTMTKIEWYRLPRAQAADVLGKIGASAESAVFSEQLTEVTWRPLPFYERFKLFRLTNYATLPCFTMDYLGDDVTGIFYPLDGLANTIYNVNEEDKLHLSESNIIDYLDFFFEEVRGPDGDIYLIKNPSDLPILSSLPENQKQSVIEHHRALQIDSDIMPGEFNINGTLYYDGSLISALIRVQASGRLSIHNQTLLLQGIHFPGSPIENTYMGDSY
jgi:hypothetical protein